jgi:ribonuclease D
MKNYQLIHNEFDSNLACIKIKKEKFIAVDTEFFLQRKKFVLSTIQICTSNECYIFDISDGLRSIPDSLKKIFESRRITKVFHACQQDIKILRSDFDIKIENVFDTQIGMMFLSSESYISYKDLVKKLLNISIEKLHKNDDWEARPLSESQTNYLIQDVSYLFQCYSILLRDLKQARRLSWFREYINEFLSSTDRKKNEKFELNYDQIMILNILKYLLKMASLKKNISEKLICDTKDLIELIIGRGGRLKDGWRWKVFGKMGDGFLKGAVRVGISDLVCLRD